MAYTLFLLGYLTVDDEGQLELAGAAGGYMWMMGAGRVDERGSRPRSRTGEGRTMKGTSRWTVRTAGGGGTVPGPGPVPPVPPVPPPHRGYKSGRVLCGRRRRRPPFVVCGRRCSPPFDKVLLVNDDDDLATANTCDLFHGHLRSAIIQSSARKTELDPSRIKPGLEAGEQA